MKTRFDRPIPFDIGPLYSAGDKIEPPEMWTDSTDFVAAAANNILTNLTKETDDIIRACLNSYLGREDWTAEELKVRCFRVIPADKSYETYCIDNTALVIFYPADFVVENNTARLTRKYKILIDLEKEDGQQSR